MEKVFSRGNYAYSDSTVYSDIRRRVDLQELKDAYVTSRILQNAIGNKVQNLEFKDMGYGCHFDLQVDFDLNDEHICWAIEIKERIKNDFAIQRFPNSELKEDKYNSIIQNTTSFSGVYYCQLLNCEYAFFYDLRNLDWSNIEKKNWDTKIKQLNVNSKSWSKPTYFIPYSQATIFNNINKYYKEFENKIS